MILEIFSPSAAFKAKPYEAYCQRAPRHPTITRVFQDKNALAADTPPDSSPSILFLLSWEGEMGEREQNSPLDTTTLEKSPLRRRPTFQITALNGKNLHAYVGNGIKVGSIRITKKGCVYSRLWVVKQTSLVHTLKGAGHPLRLPPA